METPQTSENRILNDNNSKDDITQTIFNNKGN